VEKQLFKSKEETHIMNISSVFCTFLTHYQSDLCHYNSCSATHLNFGLHKCHTQHICSLQNISYKLWSKERNFSCESQDICKQFHAGTSLRLSLFIFLNTFLEDLTVVLLINLQLNALNCFTCTGHSFHEKHYLNTASQVLAQW
jgi:hypothetical protein